MLGAAAEDARCWIACSDNKLGLIARAVGAEHGDESRLARFGVAADRFAGFGFGAFGIQQIVDDLESKAKIMRIGAKRVMMLLRGLAKNGARFGRKRRSIRRFSGAASA